MPKKFKFGITATITVTDYFEIDIGGEDNLEDAAIKAEEIYISTYAPEGSIEGIETTELPE